MPGSRPGRDPARIYRIHDYHTVFVCPVRAPDPAGSLGFPEGRHRELRHFRRKVGDRQLYELDERAEIRAPRLITVLLHPPSPETSNSPPPSHSDPPSAFRL